MKFDRHLFLSEVTLPPSGEWTDSSEGWRLVRLSKGAAYWLAEGTARELNEGEVVALGPSGKGCLRTKDPDLSIIVRGDSKLKYQHVVNVLEVLQQANVLKVSMATDAVREAKPKK